MKFEFMYYLYHVKCAAEVTKDMIFCMTERTKNMDYCLTYITNDDRFNCCMDDYLFGHDFGRC